MDNPRLYNLSHNEHHRYTLHQPDDLEVVLPQKATVLQLLLINFLDYKTLFNRVRTTSRWRLAVRRVSGIRTLCGAWIPHRRAECISGRDYCWRGIWPCWP